MDRLELLKVHLATWQLTAIVTVLFIITQERLELTRNKNTHRTFSCRCAPGHLPVWPQARTQRWKWKALGLPWPRQPGGVQMWNTAKYLFVFLYPNLSLSRELDDPLVIGPLFLLTNRSDSDDHVDVVSVTLGAGVLALGLQGPVEGLAKGGRASGADNAEIN